MEYDITPEQIKIGVEAFAWIIPIAFGMAFSQRQRDWFIQVYKGKCQGRNIGMKHKCGSDLQIHHITPQMWAYSQGMAEEEVDSETNGIPLCADAHVGKRGTEDCLHPDQVYALTDYIYNHNEFAFGQLQDRRQMMTYSGVPYWNTRWQSNLERLAQNTITRWKTQGGSEFPSHTHRK